MARLSQRQKEDLIRQQATIDELLKSTSDPATLSAEHKKQLWNATKVINAIIADNNQIADEQLVCRQERTIGSQMAKRKCLTKAQIELERERARRKMDGVSRAQTRI